MMKMYTVSITVHWRKNTVSGWMEKRAEEWFCSKRVIKTKEGDLLNRYYDSENTPRPESYLIDIEDQHEASGEEFFQKYQKCL